MIHQNMHMLNAAVKAMQARGFHAQYPEHPKAYSEAAPSQGEAAFNAALHQPFKALLQTGETGWDGGETSPYTLETGGAIHFLQQTPWCKGPLLPQKHGGKRKADRL
ncbi:hypothetical protein GA0116948_11295 [Chitinophaga costaii]|uniref:Uncharacterized protein n=1 Tax=Chitinophaga costaii TaxID=1335309 RepID=A0A1C4F8D7_9BACT|nr:hypothetical protein [Chitinophaga costaii]SCC52082.1 hypothetical protein GA0116948_11295 [Chitinophaga costaii]